MAAKTPQVKNRMSAHLLSDRRIIIALDFGTTFSGLCWAQTGKAGVNPEIQTPIIQWPDAISGGLEGVTSDKVPTELQYDGEDFKWGYQIGDSGQRIQCFKLDLNGPQEMGASALARKYPDAMASPPAYNVSVEKLVTDYLSALRKHANEVLRHKLPQTALFSTPLEFIITVPACWTDLAQARTRACAEQAGLGLSSALHIVSEPEAAAMYALDSMEPHDIRVGDTFLLCDAGGGTVDVICYTVSALKPLLEVQEATPGAGSLCDGRRMFSKKRLKRFELIKRAFTGLNGEDFLIPVPGIRDNPQRGVIRGKFRLSRNLMKSMFDSVVQEVIELVQDQIRQCQKPVKAILLVGGFGQSAYLRDRLRQTLKTSDVEVMQSPNGWTAVVRGALIKGLACTSQSYATVQITGRAARKNYGIETSKAFDAAIHDRTRRSWDPFSGMFRSRTIDWFIEKGSIVHEDEPFHLSYNTQWRISTGRPMVDLVIYVDIYAYSDPSNTGPPMYKDASVKKLVRVVADLSNVPLHEFIRRTGADGHDYYCINFQLEVTYFSAYTQYELIHKGRNYGPVAAEYI
ncbi:hypothetical protein MMC13_000244 [Lambiella insularis]|nr:hypothetical protein [Lambiella insularis]